MLTPSNKKVFIDMFITSTFCNLFLQSHTSDCLLWLYSCWYKRSLLLDLKFLMVLKMTILLEVLLNSNNVMLEWWSSNPAVYGFACLPLIVREVVQLVMLNYLLSPSYKYHFIRKNVSIQAFFYLSNVTLIILFQFYPN